MTITSKCLEYSRRKGMVGLARNLLGYHRGMMTGKKPSLLRWAALIGLLGVCGEAGAATYYVATGDANASDSNAGTLASPWKTITKANQTLQAGDTVYIKAGTYSSFVAPARSGAPNAYITYRNYGTDNVTIAETTRAIQLINKSYISVQGLHFYHADEFLDFETARNNIVSDCTFDQMRNQGIWSGSWLGLSSQSNRIQRCVFSNFGYFTSSSDSGTCFHIGDDYSTTDHSDYNVVENSTFFHGGHDVFAISGSHNIVRSNYFHNENWYNGYGERDMITGGYANTSTRNLIEWNRVAYTGNPATLGAGGAGLNLCTLSNIVRFNCFYGCTESGVMMGTVGNYQTAPQYNMVYNNTFYTNGFNSGSPNESRDGIGLANWGNPAPITGNAIKNNIFYKNPTSINTYSVNLGNQTIAGNFQQTGDPMFVDITSPLSVNNPNVPNFQLKTNSPCIDKGVFLTTITSASGSGKVFQVAEPTYFFDGWGMVQGDQVQLQGSTQVVRITNVNYETKTVTVDNNLTWTQGQGVAMPYAGAAPDIGAFESGAGQAGSSRPPAPTNLRVISTN